MRIAVTGATGFLGRHFVGELHRRGLEPCLCSLQGRALEQLPTVAVDIHEAGEDSFARLGSPDAVVHLAWGGLPNYSSPHHFAAELPAQFRFLHGLVKSGLKRLVVTGTCLEYGMQFGPLAEHAQTAPTTAYGFAKDTLRRQLQLLQLQQPFELLWTRLFYMYGAGQGEKSLYTLLTRALQRGDREFKMSGGEQLRDFLPIQEVCRILAALALDRDATGIVNVCSGQPVSVRRLVETWIGEQGGSIQLGLGHYPYPDYEPLAFWGDASKLHSSLAAAADKDSAPAARIAARNNGLDC